MSIYEIVYITFLFGFLMIGIPLLVAWGTKKILEKGEVKEARKISVFVALTIFLAIGMYFMFGGVNQKVLVGC